MEITIARDAGYCFGVRDAVDLAYETSGENGEGYMLGDKLLRASQVVVSSGPAPGESGGNKSGSQEAEGE